MGSSSAAELGRQASPEDDGSPVKSPGRAAPKLGFLYASENRVNRLLTSTSIKEARQEALRRVLQKPKFNSLDKHENSKTIYRHLGISLFNIGP